MTNAPHHGVDENVLSSEDDDRDAPRPFHIPLRPSLEPSNRTVLPADPYSVSNAAPNFLDLFTTKSVPPVAFLYISKYKFNGLRNIPLCCVTIVEKGDI